MKCPRISLLYPVDHRIDVVIRFDVEASDESVYRIGVSGEVVV